MSTMLIAVLAMAVSPGENLAVSGPAMMAPNAAEQVMVADLHGLSLRRAVREAFQKWGRPSDEQAEQAARELLALYDQLGRDTEIAQSTVKSYRLTIRARLDRIGKQIVRYRTEQIRLAAEQPARLEFRHDDPAFLAQMFGGGGGGRGGWGGGGGGGGMMGGQGGGMMGGQGGGMMGGGMGGMGMQQRDTGEELVDLIQTTVAPDSWEENGGPGSIRFFRTNYSVIIRQTAENHEEIADMLRQLGRVNR